MKKVVKGIIYTVSVLFIAWFVLSWADIVADNTKPNPQHSEYNMFVIMTREAEQEKEEPVGMCGNPLEGTDRITFGTVYEITENSVIFETIEGELYETYVGYPSEFEKEGFYCLFFWGDEIVKAFVERW